MAIGNAVERNSYVYIYNEDGMQIALVSLPQGGTLAGYTSSRVNVRANGYIYSYDDRGVQVGLVSA